MEKIRVNMTPCEEVKTIHASQDDNATRKWAFDLYDENGKIDSSDIKEQMIFDSKVGGTEQILPENTSDPTTSPIIADIQYPDSLRSEQTFLYRGSPTTEDGQAKITHIKGNTVVFNQQIQNGNFVGTSNWTSFGTNVTTLTANNNELTFTNVSATAGYMNSLRQTFDYSRVQGHKLYYCATILSSVADEIRITLTKNMFVQETASTSYKKYEGIFNYQTPLTPAENYFEINPRSTISGSYIKVKNVILIDLTQMGLDYITSVEQFTSLYPLPYYAYTTGKLLPFKGEELKVTGKNILEVTFSSQTFRGVTFTNNGDGTLTANGTASGGNAYILIDVPSKTHMVVGHSYILSVDNNVMACGFYNGSTSESSIGSKQFNFDGTWSGWNLTIAVPNGVTVNNLLVKPMLRLASVQDSSYVPYTSSTINLPTSTYFPTGMKSAGSVYDELTESKAVTRTGSVDLGTLTWSYNTSVSDKPYFIADINSLDFAATLNYVCSIYSVCPSISAAGQTSMANRLYELGTDKSLIRGTSVFNYIGVRDSSYTDAPTFQTAMSGVYLYYELETPTEESITTASLVTEKGEAPLYYDDELIADCNETISSESGIFDAKIKLMADETIYSQKIQLHVERKPQ